MRRSFMLIWDITLPIGNRAQAILHERRHCASIITNMNARYQNIHLISIVVVNGWCFIVSVKRQQYDDVSFSFFNCASIHAKPLKRAQNKI